MLTNKINTKAFSLAEILISLVIIGIIAAITIPLLFADFQKQALKSALKKNYSVLKQALYRYYIENGENLYSSTVADTAGSGKAAISKYMNILNDNNNKAYVAQNDTETYKTYNNKSSINMYNFDDGQFVLSDGSLILIQNDVWNAGSYGDFFISVDVNGVEKKPNRLGKDLFMFQLNENGELIPMGAKGTKFEDANTYCSNTSSNNMNGAGCTNKALLE